MRACFSRFSFVTNHKPLIGSFFGTRSAPGVPGPHYRTHPPMQYDDDKADACYTHEMDSNILFNGSCDDIEFNVYVIMMSVSPQCLNN